MSTRLIAAVLLTLLLAPSARSVEPSDAQPRSEIDANADWSGPRSAAPRQLRIASGPLGHTYDRIYAVNMLRMIEGFRGHAQRTGGSAENLEILARGDAEVGFTQADVYAAEVRRHESLQDLVVLGSLANECVYIAYRRDGPVQSFDQLRGPVDGRPPRVAVGSAGGGGQGTWRNLGFLDERLAAADVHPQGGALALNQLVLGRFDAVLWVTDPRNQYHTMLRIVRDNGNLGLMSVDDPSFEVEMRDGISMYEQKVVRTSPGWFGSGAFGSRLRTLCTHTLVVARPDASSELVDSVADLVGLHGEWMSRRHPEW